MNNDARKKLQQFVGEDVVNISKQFNQGDFMSNQQKLERLQRKMAEIAMTPVTSTVEALTVTICPTALTQQGFDSMSDEEKARYNGYVIDYNKIANNLYDLQEKYPDKLTKKQVEDFVTSPLFTIVLNNTVHCYKLAFESAMIHKQNEIERVAKQNGNF